MASSLSERKRKKKHWYTILAPKQFNAVKLGENQTYSIQNLMGKVLKANLMALTNDPKKQSVTLSFKIDKILSENDCTTTLVNYAINNAHIKRLVRKASNKLEDSFFVKTKDGITFRIKPLLLTRYKAHRSVLTALRKKTYELMQAYISGIDSADIFFQIISHKLQMEMKNALKKIYPIAVCEIKSFTLVSVQPKSI